MLLTSNNTRELTEALKRRCLYLWLDYPDLEHELEIVRLHSPELDETVARKLVEIIHQVRELDLKKPPSIAESIDWARALMLLGASDIDRDTFRETMSVIVKHRTDLDTVAARVGVKLEPGGRCPPPPSRRIYGGIPDRGARRASTGQLLAFAEDLREEGVAVGTSEILDAFEALEHVPWSEQHDFKEALAATLAKSPEDRRVFELVFDRFFFRAAEAEAARRQHHRGATSVGDGRCEINLDTLRQQIAAALRDGSDAALRDLARLAIAAFGQGEGSGVLGVDVQRIRRALGLRAEPQPDLPDDDPRRARASRASSCGGSSSTCAASSSAT